MKIHFEPNQAYQIEAIKSVVDIFEGQPLALSQFEYSLTETIFDTVTTHFANTLKIKEKEILTNLQKVQTQNGILPVSPQLNGLNFSIEMETGTGKTYVYLRSVYELNKTYGFKKFVIVVPSIAIREGVLKNLQITEEHFREIYQKEPCNFQVYDSTKLSGLRTFSTTNSIQILVINIDSFAKDQNIINKPNDKLSGSTPIEFIQNSNPIVIVDEPQNMETDKRKEAISKLNPLCTLRYSATHKNVYNLIYKLDPVKAYEKGLVKQIEVTSVLTQNAYNQAFIKVDSFPKNKKTSIEAKITIDCNTLLGVSSKQITIKTGSNLYELSGKREIYNNYIVNELVRDEYVEFSNGTRIYLGQSQGGFNEDIMQKQIESTIKSHFKKERKLKEKGIKVLSVFFVDRVSNYRTYNEQGNAEKGKFALWFEEYFNQYNEKEKLYDFTAEQVHNGYFSQDKKGKVKDSNENRISKDDEDTFSLIMKDKERLLDINEPLRFIFSHSALREGWDNPNVFQICTLNETKSELKKRQEIGRGLRLCVNQSGKRTDENGEIYKTDINRLTVVANESYKDFCAQLQRELQEEGIEFKKKMYENADEEKVTVKLKDKFDLDTNFTELWDKIKQKTRYKVRYETEELIQKASEALREKMPNISKPTLVANTTLLTKISDRGFESQLVSEPMPEYIRSAKYHIPDFLSYIETKTQLTRKTIAEIIKQSGRQKEILNNPQLFMDNVVKEIKMSLTELIVNGIEYEKIEEFYNQELFSDITEFELLKEIIEQHYYKVENTEKTLYNYIAIDSTVEGNFVKKCDTVEQIPFYLKLPKWFKIRTPIGNYNPDWALIRSDKTKLYFVAETKGSPDNLREDELKKVKCGKKHFAQFKDENIEYKIVKSFEQIAGGV